MQVRGQPMPQDDAQFCPIRGVDELDDDDFREIYACWDAARAGAPLPPADGLQPARLPVRLLPDIAVVGISGDGPDATMRVRLAGSAVREATGVETTRARLDAAGLPDTATPDTRSFLAAVRERIAWCRRERLPYCACGRTSWAARDYVAHRVLGLPYADAKGEVSRIVYLMRFEVGGSIGAPGGAGITDGSSCPLDRLTGACPKNQRPRRAATKPARLFG